MRIFSEENVSEIVQAVKENSGAKFFGVLYKETVPEIKPELPTNRWELLVQTVKNSELTQEMKIACIAQAALESGFGQSKVSEVCRNFWGMKFRPELEGIATPLEVPVTSEVGGKATFAKFDSISDSLVGWTRFLSRPYYAGWEAYAKDSAEFIRHIGKAWCPAKGYAEKIISLFPKARALLGIKDETPRAIRVGLLDPGHSEKHTGARSTDDSVEEENLTVYQADLLKQELASSGIDSDIVNPLGDDLAEIGYMAEKYDFLVSLHFNSYQGYSDPGHEVLVDNDKGSPESVHLAQLICEELTKALGSTNRGVKRQGLMVLDRAEQVCRGPCVLVESFFLNPYGEETAKIRAAKAASAIARAIVAYYS